MYFAGFYIHIHSFDLEESIRKSIRNMEIDTGDKNYKLLFHCDIYLFYLR